MCRKQSQPWVNVQSYNMPSVMISKQVSTVRSVQNKAKPKIPLIYIAVSPTSQHRLKTRPKSLPSRSRQLRVSCVPTRKRTGHLKCCKTRENLLSITELDILRVAPRGRERQLRTASPGNVSRHHRPILWKGCGASSETMHHQGEPTVRFWGENKMSQRKWPGKIRKKQL